ncbi:hypothetical protein CAPTEDRAFT_191799 [Capitella teleta]|uniref:Uncharacterized protein n=1 Tax=Capitella teleta TaxID=283909 RepID=R7TJG6_CAPTE|nr:hypothetical protein CAPTEDRAFT_191799 [Capitella teleta]|eukprot:ELT93963.1 hypothetical protein CAPTEDRAFT_191799 [Capitella teleta]
MAASKRRLVCLICFMLVLVLMILTLLTFPTKQSFRRNLYNMGDLAHSLIASVNQAKVDQREWRYFNLKPLYAINETTDAIPLPSSGIRRVVHFVWCEPSNAQFTFNHFLSVVASIKIIRPEAIYFNHRKEILPEIDKWTYNTWFEELLYSFPWLYLKPQSFSDICSNVGEPKASFVAGQLRQHGGIYLDLSTLILDFEGTVQEADVVTGKLPEVTSQLPSLFGCKPEACPEHLSSSAVVNHLEHKCLFVDSVNYGRNIQGYKCVVLNSSFVPAELLYLETAGKSLHNFLRKLLYGQEAIPKPEPHPKEVVPNVAHYVWFGGGQMDYVFYLSVLSVLHIVKVDAVYIHGDRPPSGPHWRRLLTQEVKVKWIHKPRPTQIYGVRVGRVEHAADVARHDIMLKYGGVHLDTDAVFNKSLDRRLFHYDAVVSLDSPLYPMRPFPDVFNLGVVLSRPFSPFWQRYQLNERYYYEGDYTWNSNRVPYKIWERNPELVHIQPFLQLICCHLKCYPTWVRERNKAVAIAEDPQRWVDKPLAVHWTAPTPPDMLNEKIMRNSSSLFAQIGHNILKAAGQW